MCLGIPGEILETHASDLGVRMGTVRFGGADREVCLEYVPEAAVGDYVIVHVGVAISQVSEERVDKIVELEERNDDGQDNAKDRAEVGNDERHAGQSDVVLGHIF